MIKTIEPYTPIQYIIGKTEFCGIDLAVDERVLIPRPETEILVQTAIDLSKSILNTQYSILDLCTGSGNVAIALMVRLCGSVSSPLLEPSRAESRGSPSTLSTIEGLTKRIPDCKIVASDISGEALEVARMNAASNGISDRIEFVESDLFAKLKGVFDIIVSNPPYVARYEFEALEREVLKEPRLALDGGEDGLDFYRKITSAAPLYLKKSGYLVLEIGFGQADEIKKIIDDTGSLRVSEVIKDYNGIDRIVVARWIN